jgi:hypothetical protein
VLTHFDPVHYPDRAAREQAGEAAARLFPATTVSHDGMELHIE